MGYTAVLNTAPISDKEGSNLLAFLEFLIHTLQFSTHLASPHGVTPSVIQGGSTVDPVG